MPTPARRPSSALKETTPFPNRILALMPDLTDSEWRLVCVIVRQTHGFRKEWDWLTHGQLKARTGRASEAVCRALDGLVRRNVVEVVDAAGRPLPTARERRRCGGPLRFRIAPAAKPEREGRKTERGLSQTGNRKAKTTKETCTKGISKEIGVAIHGPLDGSEERLTGPVNNPVDNSEVSRFLAHYRALFRTRSARGEPPLLSWGKDAGLAGQMLRAVPYERLAELLEQFFASPEPWIRRSGYSLGAFRSAVNSLLVREGPAPDPGPPRRAGGWSRAGREGLPPGPGPSP